MNELKEFIGRLHASYNVTNVILTSDHGFLLNDIDFKEKDKHPVKEDFVEKKTRYYLTRKDDDADESDKMFHGFLNTMLKIIFSYFVTSFYRFV